jgi:putative tricarboxylic transport membrane protein
MRFPMTQLSANANQENSAVFSDYGILPLLWRIVSTLRERGLQAARPGAALSADPAPAVAAGEQESGGVSLALGFVMLSLMGFALMQAFGFRPDARLLPLIALIPGVLFAALALLGDASRRVWRKTDTSEPTLIPQQIFQFAILFGYVVAVWLFGFGPATILYLLGILLVRSGLNPLVAAAYAGLVYVGALQLANLMNLLLPRGVLLHLF